MAFTENLCDLMQKHNISSYKLAKDIGVHTSTVSNWREGRQPILEHAKKLAEYFGKTIEEMME